MTTEGLKESMQRWIDHHSERADKAEELIDKLVDALWGMRNCRAAGFRTPFGDLVIAKADEVLALSDKWRK